jgi:hypothetical protein
VLAGFEDDTCKKGTCINGCDGQGVCAMNQAGTCVNYNTRKFCDTAITQKVIDCPYGCLDGTCRDATYATIGRSGEVTCMGIQCDISISSCAFDEIKGAFCGFSNASESINIACDGPNDCASNQVCCYKYNTDYGEQWTGCTANTNCSNLGNLAITAQFVCDPLLPNCPTGSCKAVNNRLGESVYTCR